MRMINEIVVHCSATHADWKPTASVEEKRAIVRRWHQGRNWKREGYHHFIDRDGSECAGRPDSMKGAGVRGRNDHTLHVCLFGGHGSSADDLPGENFTPEQLGALRAYLIKKQKEYPSIVKISGHNQYANKACPGFNVPRWWGEEQKVKRVRQPFWLRWFK